MEDSKFDYAVLSERFRKAEEIIKRVEEIDQRLSICSVNQLRYAGNHLLRHLAGDKPKENYDQVQHHIGRALYDAYEAGILFALRDMKEFHKNYGTMKELQERSAEYKPLRELARRSQRLINEARVETDSREELYSQCEPYFEQLIEGVAWLQDIEPMLLQCQKEKYLEALRQGEQERKQKWSNTWAAIAAIGTAVGIAIGLAV